MSSNSGSFDRLFRIIVGIVLLLMTPLIGGMVGFPILGISSIWGWIGIVPLLTGLIGWCALYAILGINTRGAQS